MFPPQLAEVLWIFDTTDVVNTGKVAPPGEELSEDFLQPTLIIENNPIPRENRITDKILFCFFI